MLFIALVAITHFTCQQYQDVQIDKWEKIFLTRFLTRCTFLSRLFKPSHNFLIWTDYSLLWCLVLSIIVHYESATKYECLVFLTVSCLVKESLIALQNRIIPRHFLLLIATASICLPVLNNIITFRKNKFDFLFVAMFFLWIHICLCMIGLICRIHPTKMTSEEVLPPPNYHAQ